MMISLFRFIDTDNNKKLDKKELLAFMKLFSEQDIKEVNIIIDKADLNNDGHIDQDEFCQFVIDNKILYN